MPAIKIWRAPLFIALPVDRYRIVMSSMTVALVGANIAARRFPGFGAGLGPKTEGGFGYKASLTCPRGGSRLVSVTQWLGAGRGGIL